MATLNKGTTVFIGATATATDLASAELAATTEFTCATIANINGLGISRETITPPDNYCTDATSFNPDDTGSLKVAPFTLSTFTVSADAAQALARAAILADTACTIVIVEPNGTDKLWFKGKFTLFDVQRGGPTDYQQVSIEFIASTMPADA